MKTLILAGGKSRRMGREKALIERPDGERQIDFILRLAHEVSDDVSISTNTPKIAPEGIPALADESPGDGPLGALATWHLQNSCPTMVIGVDLFLLDKPTLENLIRTHDSSNLATCYANRLDAQPEPLCTIYSADALKMASESLADGKYCTRDFLRSLDPNILQLPSPVALDNVNTESDLAEAFAKITGGVTEKELKILYFALLREARGLSEETHKSYACTVAGLYEELRFKHRLPLKQSELGVARNGDFCKWQDPILDGDELVFIPPVAGG